MHEISLPCINIGTKDSFQPGGCHQYYLALLCSTQPVVEWLELDV